MLFNIIEVRPGVQHAYGATLGQKHMRDLARRIGDADLDTMVLLDFHGVLSVTPSYLKATILQAVPSDGSNGGESNQARNVTSERDLFPAITGCSPGVASDIHEYFSGLGLPILHITKRREDRILAAKFLGCLDELLFKTLSALTDRGAGTAGELAENSDDTITINGWNNRLANLHLLRLATRHRKGKFWIYSPVAERITRWG